MPSKMTEQKLKLIIDNYYNEVFFNLISEYTNRLDVLQKEKEILKKQYEFISLISHQLRTPISAIKILLELAAQDIKDKYLAEGINEKIKNINSLINDLLFFSGISDSDDLKKDEKFFLSKIIEDGLGSLKENFEKKKISVNFKKPDFKTTARGDKKAAGRVVRYLLNNAAAYNKENGSVKISVARAGKDFLKVCVKDSGFGIPQKEQNRVFEKFFRATNASLGKNEGSGVNLHIAKKLVESWGGKIGFKSEESRGSTFYFTIPIKSD